MQKFQALMEAAHIIRPLKSEGPQAALLNNINFILENNLALCENFKILQLP